MKISLFVIVTFVAYTSASICCPPMKEYGMTINLRGGIFTTATASAGLMSANLQTYVDMEKKMLAMDEMIYNAEGKLHMQMLQDFNKKIEYVVLNGACSKAPLTAPIEDFVCIKDDAKFLGSYDYAMGKLKGKEYQFVVERYGQSQNMIMTVTDKCIPLALQLSAEETAKSYKYVIGGTYYNVTDSIKDPSVFDVPASCLQKTEQILPINKGNLVQMPVDTEENRIL